MKKKAIKKECTVLLNGKPYNIINDNGTLRFDGNRLIRFLIDTHNTMDFNAVWQLADTGMITRDELIQFYTLVGYSVDNFAELFPELAELLPNNNDTNKTS
jgi:hypothetical protein